MYLVDTSVWIDYLRDKENGVVNRLAKLLDDRTPVGITSIIYQEILQGAATQQDFANLANYFGTMQFFHPIDQVQTFHNAAKIYFNCRKAGITLRSTIDCIIVQIAIENKLILLHNDKDFAQINKVVPALVLLSNDENWDTIQA